MPWSSLQELTAPLNSASPLHTTGHLILDAQNNVVYLRGIGRAGDLNSLSGTWGGNGDAAYDCGEAWQTNMSALTSKMDQTFACYRDLWKVNLVRILIPVDWWWQDKVNPYLTCGQGPDQMMSYCSYIQLMVQQAQRYGIYVDFCPYEVHNFFVNADASDGIPGSPGASSLSYMHSINPDEIRAWQVWWISVVNRLGQYPNFIFEMWNEPDDGTNTAASATAAAYFNYTIQSYEAIRATGNSNLIFMQWHAGLVPNFTELEWVPQLYNQLKNDTGSKPITVAFTTHPYRRSPVPNLEWATTYSGVQAQLNSPSMVPATRSNGTDVPLIFNEMGVMSNPTVYSNDFYPEAQQPESNLTFDQKIQKELSFWSAIVINAKQMGIGVCAYYWMPA
jgi:hypothetical protein